MLLHAGEGSSAAGAPTGLPMYTSDFVRDASSAWGIPTIAQLSTGVAVLWRIVLPEHCGGAIGAPPGDGVACVF